MQVYTRKQVALVCGVCELTIARNTRKGAIPCGDVIDRQRVFYSEPAKDSIVRYFEARKQKQCFGTK